MGKIFYTYIECKEEASKYNSRSEFKNNTIIKSLLLEYIS